VAEQLKMELKKEKGTIIGISGQKAKIKLVGSTACKGCPGAGLCSMLGKRYMRLEAENPLGAKTGQEVMVSIPTESELKAAFIVFIIPTISLFVGAILGYYLNLLGNQNFSSLFFLTLFVVLSFLGIRQYSKRYPFKPVITEIL
jgi:sigma-E factor negative regulatory protein RseC